MQLTREECKIYERALVRAKDYLSAEAALLDSIVEIDRTKLYKKFDEEFLTPFCVKHFRISEEVAATFVRVARKSLAVPELKLAVEEGRLDITKAKTIASVVTSDNVQMWTERAADLSKAKLEYEVVKENPTARRSERAKPVGEDRFRLECELRESVYLKFQRARDLASQSRGTSSSVAETIEAMLETYLKYRDPVEKAKRAHTRKATAKSAAKEKTEGTAAAKGGIEEMCSAIKGAAGETVSTIEDATEKTSTDKAKMAEATADSMARKDFDRSRERSAGSAASTHERSARKPIPASERHAVNLRDQRKCQQTWPMGRFAGKRGGCSSIIQWKCPKEARTQLKT